MLKRFHDKEEDDVYERFIHLKQKGTVSECIHEWEVLVVRKRGCSDEELLKTYHCGLKNYIREELKLHKPKTIEDARHAGIIIKRKYKLHKASYATDEKSNNYSKGKSSKPSSRKYVPPPMHNGGRQQLNVERKKDGKCQTCRDKYYIGHKCAMQKIYNYEVEQEKKSSEDKFDEENNEDNVKLKPES